MRNGIGENFIPSLNDRRFTEPCMRQRDFSLKDLSPQLICRRFDGIENFNELLKEIVENKNRQRN